MATDPVLRMLGLARRAGKLAYGDELVREACFDTRPAVCSLRVTQVQMQRKKPHFTPIRRMFRA